MNSRILLPIVLTVAILALLGMGCSDDKGANNNGGGGGGGREFVSGDLGVGESYSHTFTTSKVVRYYCRYHGGPNGQGMSGTITVTPSGTAAQFQSSITASALQNLTIPVGSTIQWTNNHIMVHTVESDN